MSDRELNQVENVFHAVLDLPPDEREAYLVKACNGDKSMYAEVISLVSAFDSREGFIEEPALNLGLKVLSDSAKEPMIGKIIGPYNVVSRLGKGGMGEVYLAEDTRLGRNVGLKFISQEFVGDNWAKRQLVKEAQAVAILDHPNICPVYGIEEFDEHTFIVMQYVEGETLADLISRNSIAADQVVPFARQIVGALAEAHAHGIIHRDIKPKNIMVTRGRQIKVLDFGLAKTVQRPKGMPELTDDSISHLSSNGLLPGTIAYMSPEQLRGERLDYRSDVFSVGTVLYEMLCGMNPFSRGNPAETISAILSTKPTPLKQTLRQAPKELDRVVLKCLEKNCDDRYQSSSDLLIELETLLAASTPRTIDWAFSTRTAITLTLALLLTFVSVFVYFQLAKTRRVAILPIVNMTGDVSLNYISDGFADTVSTKLSGLAKLRVKPAATLVGYKNGGAEPIQIGKELSVDGVLKGTLSRVNQAIVLHVALYSTTDGSALWEDQYQVDDSQSVFATESDIAQKITSKMEFRSRDDERKAQLAIGPSNPEARKHFWLGKHYWKNRGNNKSTLDDAIQHFTAAIQLEPTFAEAYAALADCYSYLNVVAYGQAGTKEAMSKAVRAAKDAVELNNKLPEAHNALASVYMKYYWDWPEAEKEFKEAIALDPEFAPAHYGYSVLLTIRGRTSEAISEGRLALDLDPFSPATNLNYCRTYFFARRFEESTACFDRLVNDFADYDTGRYVRGWIYFHLGRRDEATATFEQLYAKNKRLGGAALGYAYGQLGKRADAARVLKEMFALPADSNLPPQEIALIYYGMGDMDNALVWFEKSAKEHFGPFAFLGVDPIFEKLRADQRFMDLFRRYDVPFPHPTK